MGAHDDWLDTIEERESSSKPIPIPGSSMKLLELKASYRRASLTPGMTLMQAEEALTRVRYYGSKDHSGSYEVAVLRGFNPAAIGPNGPIAPSAELTVIEGHKKTSGSIFQEIPLSHIAPLHGNSFD